MGTLEDLATGKRQSLGARCVVGRADHCGLRIEHAAVSGEHAVIRFCNGRWHLRDLGSRNGTQVDAQPLEPGREIPVSPGAVLTFGSRTVRWRLTDTLEPNLRAHRDDGTTACAANGLLILPDEEAPECALCADDDGWMLEWGDQRRIAVDQEQLRLSSGSWRLEVPSGSPLESTASSGVQPRRLQRARLSFRVSSDGEHVEIDIQGVGWERALGARAHNDVLLALARARLADQRERSQLPEADQGWVYGDELCRMAGISPSALDLHVFRARRQLAEAGVHNAGQIVERRPATKQLRLGVADLAIEPSA